MRKVLLFSSKTYASVCICLFLLCGCSFFREAPPDDALLRQRVSAMIALGWGWLHADAVVLQHGEWDDSAYLGHFAYEIVFDQDDAALPEHERERYRTYLPMCAHTPPKKGGRCRVEESVAFVKTEDYGWMPLLVQRHIPHLMPEIVRWTESK